MSHLTFGWNEFRKVPYCPQILSASTGAILFNESPCILQHQLTGQYTELNVKTILFRAIQFKYKRTVNSQNHSLVQFDP